MSEKHPGPPVNGVFTGKFIYRLPLCRGDYSARQTAAQQHRVTRLQLLFSTLGANVAVILLIHAAEQKLEPRHAMLLRCRLPGGVITTTQWQAIDKFAGENTIYGSIRLTNRQT